MCAANPVFQGRVKAPLAFDIGPDDLQRGTSAGGCKVAWAPEMVSPELARDLGIAPGAQPSGRHAFERVDAFCQLDGWRVLDEQMDMVVLPIHFDQGRAKVPADADETSGDGLWIEPRWRPEAGTRARKGQKLGSSGPRVVTRRREAPRAKPERLPSQFDRSVER